jgi:hypothetical protein
MNIGRKRIRNFLIGSVWLAVVLGATAIISQYKATAGKPASAPMRWPAESRLHRSPGRSTLMMIAHPFCPCTRASLAELSKLADRLGRSVSTHVVFIRPAGASEEWEHSELWDRARTIPEAEVFADTGGLEAARFGGFTSGQVLLYASSGDLQFAGGITAARGHEGDNPGADRVLALVTKGQAELAQAPVFGCSLQDPKQEEQTP